MQYSLSCVLMGVFVELFALSSCHSSPEQLSSLHQIALKRAAEAQLQRCATSLNQALLTSAGEHQLQSYCQRAVGQLNAEGLTRQQRAEMW